jgi:hypothetical protein
MFLNLSDLIDVILYWNANNCQVKKYTSILQTLLLYVVVIQQDRTNIAKRTKSFILKEIKFEH